MIHQIKTSPAYDTAEYGQHPFEFHFLCQDTEGVLCFTLVTGWRIRLQNASRIGTSASFTDAPKSEYCLLSFHKHATLLDCVDNEPHENCGWLDGPCIAHEPFGCTGHEIGDLFMTFITEGLEGLWVAMDKIYEEIRNDLH